MNARRAREPRRARGPLSQQAQIRITELDRECSEAIAALQRKMAPAYAAISAQRRELADREATLNGAYRRERTRIRAEHRERVDAVHQAAAQNILVTSEVPT